MWLKLNLQTAEDIGEDILTNKHALHIFIRKDVW